MKIRRVILNHFIRFIADKNGATAIEYALIGALVSTAIIGALNSLQSNMTNMYVNVSTTITR